MIRKILFLLFVLSCFFFTPATFAADDSFVSVVNPIRGADFWDLKGQQPDTAVLGQASILDEFNLPATWLLRFDALNNSNIVKVVKEKTIDEKGLFLEVTPSWTSQAKVRYRKSDSWHAAASAFLTGYELAERKKLIDTAFQHFKTVFGYYPKSVGAWWIDSYSMGYMEEKYGISSALIVADQFSTDNYQIWGQYFSTPYYPAKNNALHPAQSLGNKSNIVMVQWAARDPVNSYGNGVDESTFSLQANDYMDYHDLDNKYFTSLVDIFTKQKFNQFSQVVVGLENSYQWKKYKSEYRNQIGQLSAKKNTGQISVVTMADFAAWYKTNFPEISPAQIIIADDPLGSFKKAVWFMNPYYRAALFVNQDGVVFRDIRQYIDGEEELCFTKSCVAVNFATFVTRVLDDITYGQKWVIDEGRIEGFNVSKKAEGYLISYINEAGNKRHIEFLPRDIKVDDKVFTIDGAILNVIKQDQIFIPNSQGFNLLIKWSASSIVFKLLSYLVFLILVCLIPGLVLADKLLEKNAPLLLRIFLSTVVGLVFLTVLFYILGILNLKLLFIGYIIVFLAVFIKLRIWQVFQIKQKNIDKLSFASLLVIIVGTIFQNIPTFRSGLTFENGMGFWGPNTHDGVWHIALVNQLIQAVPPQNPIQAGEILKNYHFFYDLLVAATATVTKIPIIDLAFRFYPILFSILLGIGTYYLVLNFLGGLEKVKAKIAVIFSLYFVYFSGSFGWIVEYIKGKTLGGESAFWANQAISFNLNPPFATSLLIVIACLIILMSLKKTNNLSKILISSLLIGSLAGFKSYAAILMIGSLIPIAVFKIVKKEFTLTYITGLSILFSLIIFLSNFSLGYQLIIYAPFWFIHSMVDSPSRIGWERLTMARVAGLQTSNFFKYISAEAIGLLLFIVGNLGMRTISVGSLWKIKEIIRNDKCLFILIFSTFSFIIPILFIQAGTPWNTIQFSYYGLYLTAVVSGAVLSKFLFSFPKALGFCLVFIILIFAPVNSITTSTYYLGMPHAIVNAKELEALNFLSKQQQGTVLTYPYDENLKKKLAEPRPLFAYDSTAYVAALSGKSVYLEDEPQNEILLNNYKKRLVASKDFFLKPVSENISFLEKNNIKYIYLPTIYNVKLDESNKILINIFENEEAIIYKIN